MSENPRSSIVYDDGFFVPLQEFGCQEDMTFCGIFDGHGPWGHFVSKKVRESIVSSLLCIWQESLAEASADPDLDKKAQRFNIWKESFLKACATVDQELEHHPKIDTFYSGTTALTIVRQVICFSYLVILVLSSNFCQLGFVSVSICLCGFILAQSL